MTGDEWVHYCHLCRFEITGEVKRLAGKTYCAECYTRMVTEIKKRRPGIELPK